MESTEAKSLSGTVWCTHGHVARVMSALCKAAYSWDLPEFALACYGDAWPVDRCRLAYLEGKFKKFKDDPLTIYAQLDSSNQYRFHQAILAVIDVEEAYRAKTPD